jgi:hypothetical protein
MPCSRFLLQDGIHAAQYISSGRRLISARGGDAIQIRLTAERRIDQRFSDHPAIYACNFANEPALVAVPQTYADGAAWNRMLEDPTYRWPALVSASAVGVRERPI